MSNNKQEPLSELKSRIVMNSSDHRQKKIRLALVAHRFQIGGLERCMATLVNNLPKELIEPTVIAFGGDCSAAKWIDRTDVNVISLKNSFPNDPRLTLRLANAIRRNKIDIVHSHNWGSLIESGVATRLCRIPHVHAEHGLEFSQNESGWRRRIKPMLKRRFFRNATSLVAIAECVKQRLGEVYEIDREKVTLIPNGVPRPSTGNREHNYRDLRQKLGLPEDALIAGTVGRAAHVKGFDDAIRAFKPLAEKSSKFHLVIVGGGPELERLRELSDSLSIRNQVHLVGFQLNIGYWLTGFDLFFNSSRSEAMNLGIIEAMAVGLPIVAMDVGDNAIMIQNHGVCGRVARKGDIEIFSQSLQELLSNRLLADEMGRQSLSVYERRFTVANMTDSYLSLYKRTLADHPKGKTMNFLQTNQV